MGAPPLPRLAHATRYVYIYTHPPLVIPHLVPHCSHTTFPYIYIYIIYTSSSAMPSRMRLRYSYTRQIELLCVYTISMHREDPRARLTAIESLRTSLSSSSSSSAVRQTDRVIACVYIYIYTLYAYYTTGRIVIIINNNNTGKKT